MDDGLECPWCEVFYDVLQGYPPSTRLEAVLLADPALSADLALLVERVCQNRQPWVVVVATALTAWQQRDPVGWEKVSEWLAANGIALVRI
jgi:hypothetical protein